MARGDHFFVWRKHKGIPFQHHAIDVGEAAVHLSDGHGGVATPGVASDQFVVQRTSLESVSRGGRDRIHVVSHPQPRSADDIVERALSQVGRRGYHVVFDNCEHFAWWCVTDRNESRQVSVACERLGAVSVKVIAAGTARAAGAIGTRRIVRGATPMLLVADAAQWVTEAGGHHVGLRDANKRKQAGRAIGITTAIGVGACAGPIGCLVAGSLWAAGELAGEMSLATYRQIRTRRVEGGGRDG